MNLVLLLLSCSGNLETYMKIKGESPFFLLLQHGHVEGKKRFGSIISRLGAWPSGNTVMQRPRCPRNKMSAILVLASKASSYQAGKRMCSPVLLGTLVSAPPLAAEYTWQGEGRGSFLLEESCGSRDFVVPPAWIQRSTLLPLYKSS